MKYRLPTRAGVAWPGTHAGYWAVLFVALLLSVSLRAMTHTRAGVRARSPQEAHQRSKQAAPAYRLRPGDKVSVRFLYQPEFNELQLVVRPDGCITLQLVDDVTAAGLTAAELQRAVELAYREILLSPVITINVLEFVAPRVFVYGQVGKPGVYELRAGHTLLQAISLAGGFIPAAHRKLVLHATPVAGHELAVSAVDVARLLAPGSRATEIELKDGDYVFVPDSKLAKFSRVVEAFRFAVPGFTVR